MYETRERYWQRTATWLVSVLHSSLFPVFLVPVRRGVASWNVLH